MGVLKSIVFFSYCLLKQVREKESSQSSESFARLAQEPGGPGGTHTIQECCEELPPRISVCKLGCYLLFLTHKPEENKSIWLCHMSDFSKKIFMKKKRNSFSNFNRVDVFLFRHPPPPFMGLMIWCVKSDSDYECYYKKITKHLNHVLFLYWYTLFILIIYNKVKIIGLRVWESWEWSIGQYSVLSTTFCPSFCSSRVFPCLLSPFTFLVGLCLRL